MPPKPPTLYDLKKTTVVFAVSGVLLTAGLLGMVFQDSTREWKNWQKRFMDYSRHQVEEQLEKTKSKQHFKPHKNHKGFIPERAGCF